MKCLITGRETLDKTKNVPLSKEGRTLLNNILELHNEKIFKVFAEKNKEANNGVDLDEKTLRNFAPSINKKKAIELLLKEESDIMETKAEILDVRS